jgi:hypothetical protein
MKRRIVVLRKRYELDDKPIPIAVISCPVDLSANGRSLQRYRRHPSARQRQQWAARRVFVIDPVARALAALPRSTTMTVP